ncbi:MAG: transcriptional regulator, partial [Thaumarchaeota archaeon]|nr:transcriptional regulator [Nitrososphaerota archaeon]
MPGFDSLIGKSLVHIIKKNLGQSTLDKIENRVFEKFGTNLIQVSNDFPKLDLILRECFGDGAKGMEMQLLQHIISVQQSQVEDKEWVTIEDPYINRII